MKLVLCALVLVSLIPLAFAQTDPINTRQLENEITSMINDHRLEMGLNRLTVDSGIQVVARGHLARLAETGLYQHETPGLTENAVQRGVRAGYTMCGDSSDIKKYQDTTQSLRNLRAKVADYNKKVLALNSQPNNIALKNWAIQEQQKLTSEKQKILADISYVNRAILNNRIGIGLEEVLAQTSLSKLNLQTLSEDIFLGWMNSPGHKQVLEDPAHSIGVLVIVDSQNDRILVAANTC